MTESQFSHSKDYYSILGVSSTSKDTEIRDNFMKFHPDNKVSGNSERFMAVKEAYDVLKSPSLRASYDLFRTGHDRSGRYEAANNSRSSYRGGGPHRETWRADYSDEWTQSARRTRPPTMDEQWSHIHRVYEKLNREEERLRDENYRRKWRADERAWKYNTRGYSNRSTAIPLRPGSIVGFCFIIIGVGIAANLINYNLYLKRIANQSIRKSHINALDADYASSKQPRDI
ncbi:dnaJ, partial [Fragariocoptes setiger]